MYGYTYCTHTVMYNSMYVLIVYLLVTTYVCTVCMHSIYVFSMYVCMYVCFYVCMYVCMNVYMNVCMYECIHTCSMYVRGYYTVYYSNEKIREFLKSETVGLSVSVWVSERACLVAADFVGQAAGEVSCYCGPVRIVHSASGKIRYMYVYIRMYIYVLCVCTVCMYVYTVCGSMPICLFVLYVYI